MTEDDIRHEIAHLARAELHTADLPGSLWFFTEMLGMREAARQGDSVYLRCEDDPYHHSLKITRHNESGLALLGWRTTSREALERRAVALERAGLGAGYTKGDAGVGETFAFTSPDGHPMELVWDLERFYHPNLPLPGALATHASSSRRPVPSRRLDHVSILASNVTTQREALEQSLGFTTLDHLADGGTEHGAWLSVNSLGHEIAIIRDVSDSPGGLHHLAFWHGSPQYVSQFAEVARQNGLAADAGSDIPGLTEGASLYVLEPGGNRIELIGDTNILRIRPEWETRA